MNIAPLLSDTLWFILLSMLLIAVWRIRRNDWLCTRWKSIIDHPIGIVCSLIILCFVSITTLDSIRFSAEQTDSYTLLDQLYHSPKSQIEKSYSRPFARHALHKQSVVVDGKINRIYPPLKHVVQTENHVSHIALLIAGSLGAGLLLGLAIFFVTTRLGWLTLDHKHWFWMTLSLLLSLLIASLLLSADYHILGTDKVGHDTFYEAIKGVRTAVLIGTLTTLIMLPFAIVMGLLAGYFRGWIDDVIQYIYTTLNSVPGILLIASMILIAQTFIQNNPHLFNTEVGRVDFRFMMLCAILGLTSWTGLCRLLRAETLKIRALDYVDAARAFGVSNRAILAQHILPNISHIIIITIVLDFSGLVLAEAVLSYVGIGVEPSMPSWGNMINHSRLELARIPVVWWSLAAAFGFMLILVLAVNLLADRIRDAFDPRQ